MFGHHNYKATIMVVEDSSDTRSVLLNFLVLEGYRVVESDNGREAVHIVRRKCPDLILMDLHMPLMDGLAATEQIREFKDTCSDVPIVAITAYDSLDMRDAAIGAGCNEYLTKPLDFAELEKVLGGLLKGT
jgi:CheY-like chemotaxis protein